MNANQIILRFHLSDLVDVVDETRATDLTVGAVFEFT